MRGTLLNTATVAVGASIGLAAGSFVPESYEHVALEGLGLVASLIGVKLFFEGKNAVITAAAIALGGLAGAVIGIAPALDWLAEWTRQRLGGHGHFNEGLITTSVLFCVGPMTLLGCLQDGIEGQIELLAIKSTMDGIAAIFFAAALGPGVLVTALVVLVVQGTITLCARPLQRIAQDPDLIGAASAVGGALMLGIGLGLLGIKKMRMETYLPALVLAPAFAALARRFMAKKEIEA